MNAFIDVVNFNHHLILIFTLLTYSWISVKCSDLFTYYRLQNDARHSSIRTPACWCEMIKEKNKLQLCVMLQHWNDHLWVKPGSFACSIWSCVELHYLYTGTLYKKCHPPHSWVSLLFATSEAFFLLLHWGAIKELRRLCNARGKTVPPLLGRRKDKVKYKQA